MPEEELVISVDRDRIEQVLYNLISNALKYSPADTQVNVEVKRLQQSEHDEVVVAVHDKGQGISQEDQEHLFERFYRAHHERDNVEGLGLGLYITQAIVSQHKGRIWVESQLDQGSSFYFTLPY